MNKADIMFIVDIFIGLFMFLIMLVLIWPDIQKWLEEHNED